MKREIKFRAFTNWSEPYMVFMDNYCTMYDLQSQDGWTVMQYTGIKDINSVEIYEGDIIEFKQHLFNTKTENCPVKRKEVRWAMGRGAWNIFETNAGESDITVIGNIYENPELLTQ